MLEAFGDILAFVPDDPMFILAMFIPELAPFEPEPVPYPDCVGMKPRARGSATSKPNFSIVVLEINRKLYFFFFIQFTQISLSFI